MKRLLLMLPLIGFLALARSQAVEPAADKQENLTPKLDPTANPTEPFIVTGTMKQIIGTFSTYGHPKVGDTFEIDLANRPKDKITFADPPPVSAESARRTVPYIPFSAPLNIERVDKRENGDGSSLILLSSRSSASTLLLQVRAHSGLFTKGGPVTILLYQESYGRILCMAEAEGVLK